MILRHVTPLNDLLPHRDDDCPCQPREKDGVAIHNAWDGREQMEPDFIPADYPGAPKINIYKDGDSWCAQAGMDFATGYTAFGDSPGNALENLFDANRN